MEQMSANAQWFRRGDHTRGTRLVMIGAFVGAFALLGLSAFTSLPVAGGPLAGHSVVNAVNPAFESSAGDCLNWAKPDLSDVTKVDCASQHLFEVTGTVDITSTYPKGAPFPDGALWQKISQDHCTQPSVSYLGGKLDPFGKYTVGPLNPGEQRWSEGYRTLRCGLQVAGPSGGLLPSYGTAKTQDQSDVYDPGVCLGINGNAVADPIDCAKPHTFEIIGVVDLGAALPGDHPALEKQDKVLSDQCNKIATDYTGGADLKEKGLVVAWDNRAAESWAVGSKKANCKIGAVPGDGGLVAWTGSVRNPNAPPLTTSNPPQTTSVRPQDEPTGAPMHSESTAPTSSSGPKSAESSAPASTESSAPSQTR
jgi:hypothetical protein